jgi:hypothetical protein
MPPSKKLCTQPPREGLPLLCDRIEELKLMLGLGKEVKAFTSFNQFAEVMNQVVMLARQAEADLPNPARCLPAQ